MNEKPILFSGPMIRAILSGSKTQTRRIVKPQAHHYTEDLFGQPVIYPCGENDFGDVEHPIKFYAQVGQRLWVRETWSYITRAKNENADGCLPDGTPVSLLYRADADGWENDVPWTPSIFMPRWASRITLEVTGVRVERLQEINNGDASAEGVDSWPGKCPACLESGCAFPHTPGGPCDAYMYGYKESYRKLWDEINGKKHPWASDPWVWVVEFKRIAPKEETK